MLLRYCNSIANKFGIKTGGVKKLIPNLGDKVKYVVHSEIFNIICHWELN